MTNDNSRSQKRRRLRQKRQKELNKQLMFLIDGGYLLDIVDYTFVYMFIERHKSYLDLNKALGCCMNLTSNAEKRKQLIKLLIHHGADVFHVVDRGQSEASTVSVSLALQSDADVIIPAAYQRLESEIMKLMDETKTGMFPELIDLALQYHKFEKLYYQPFHLPSSFVYPLSYKQPMGTCSGWLTPP